MTITYSIFTYPPKPGRWQSLANLRVTRTLIMILGMGMVLLASRVHAGEEAHAAGVETAHQNTVATTQPTKAYEEQPLSFAGDSRRSARQGAGRGTSFSLPSMLPILFFVLVVCGLFLGLLYLAKKYLPGHRQLFSHPAMEVLGRTHLDQRRYLSMVRVGKRILVVGVSQDEIHPVSEITDDEEITSILEVARPKTEAGLTIFQRLFQRTVIDQNAAESEAMAKVKAEELADQMSTLRERVRAIRESEEPVHRLDSIG